MHFQIHGIIAEYPHWDWGYNYCRTVLEYEIRKKHFYVLQSEAKERCLQIDYRFSAAGLK